MAKKSGKATNKKTDRLKSGPTRAGKRKAPAAGGPVSGGPGRKGRPALDYGQAAKAVSRGATLAQVARAAGTTSTKSRNQRIIGKQILGRLREQGLIQDNFNRVGYAIDDFCRGVAEQAKGAMRTRTLSYQGEKTCQWDEIDWGARTAARHQYMQAIGMLDFPAEGGVDHTPLAGLTNELLEALEAVEADAIAAELEQAAG